MTGSNSANKMPDPRESIFATHYSRTDKSCPSPTVRPLARIVKRATYYNNSCYLGPSKPEEPYRVQVYKHIINYDNQCYTSLGALDQEETFAAQDQEETLNYVKHEVKSCSYSLIENPTYQIYDDKSCPYEPSRR